jgi:dihydroorotate dehydrogenase
VRTAKVAYDILLTFVTENKTETGGLSGPPLKSLTLKALKTLRPLLPASIPIIGCGGISSGADALEYAKAGASVVQVYTSFAYGGAGTPRRIKDEVATLLRQSKQTWMDVVKEGQKLSLQQEEPKVEQHKTIEDIKQYVQDGASELADLKNQLLDILKDESTPPTKDVQST